MKIIDLHQDIILSYKEDSQVFISWSDWPSCIYDAWSLKHYNKADIDIVFGAIWPFELHWDMLDTENRTINYSHNNLESYLERYYSLEPEVTIIQKRENLQKSWLKLLLHIEGFDWWTLNQINELAKKGIKSLWFSWNFDNQRCGCSTTQTQIWLHDKGRQWIKLLEENWIIVDTAHMSDKAMMETIKMAKKPLINSHSNSYTVYNHKRNVQDEWLVLLPENTWVIGVNLYTTFVNSQETELQSFFDHIDHIRNLTWDHHICLWTDFHGIPTEKTIWWINHIQKIPHLVERVTEKYWLSFAQKFFFENAFRIISSTL